MVKQAGLGDALFFEGYDLSNDVKSVQVASPSAVLERTGIDKNAHERGDGLADGQITLDSYWNSEAGHSHPVLRALPSTDVLVTYFRGTALGSPAASVIGKQINY